MRPIITERNLVRWNSFAWFYRRIYWWMYSSIDVL